MLIEIKNRWSFDVLYSGEHETTKQAVATARTTDANLRGANLRGADLTPIRDDFWAVLCCSPKEAPALRAALIAGKVNGSTYSENGCGCLVGTLAIARGCEFCDIPGLKPNSSRPAEAFFLGIGLGETPENNQQAAIAVGWIDEFTANMREAFLTTV